MKILILGIDGMLGHKVFSQIKKNKNYEVLGTIKERNNGNILFIKNFSDNIIDNIDANNFKDIDNITHRFNPDTVINCIGLIKQLKISHDPIKSISINSLFPHKLAKLCMEKEIRLIHFSTDCVFNGSKGNYLEDDSPDAMDLYGKTKLLGEITYNNCITIRTSIIGHELKSKNGLLEWFLSQKIRVNGYINAIFSGLPTIEIANILEKYIIPNKNLKGLYHVSSSPISKYELLKLIAKTYKRDIEIVPFNNPIENRSLNSSKFKEETGYKPPEWPELVKKMYEDYLESDFYIKEE